MLISFFFFFYTICLPMLQDKESEYRAAMTQLQEAERNKERISTEMGNIQQDIDTQKVGVLIQT